jgi:Carboxypeptidase regulatory-like domain
MRGIRKLSAVVILIAGSSSLLLAQGGATGAITGTVQDASGAVVANARVSVISEATSQIVRQLVTDPSGAFTATLLPVGSYSIEVGAIGFATTKFPDVVVRITETTRLTAVLKVTGTKEIVEVQGAVATVDTTTATTGESLGSTTITTLPLATRNFQQLLTLSAGASSDLNNASQLGRGQVYIHVNGGREDNNNYLIDGISVADYAFGELTYTPLPNPDSIQEFKVSTSLYDASQGRNGGGNINATLKSGTASFHGDAWEYFRNTALDATDFFLKKVVVKQNIFGGDLGGPVGNKAKFGYFYVNYQGTRQRSGASPGTFINTSIPILPTDRSAASLMSAFSTPATPNCPAVTLPSIDPVALALLNFKSNQFGPGAGGFLFPSVPGTPGVAVTFNPTTGTCTYAVNSAPFAVTNPGKFTDDQFTANWDRDFRNGKDRLAFRFFWANSDTFQPFGADSFQVQTGGAPTPNNLNFPLDIPLHNRVSSITETHLFSNTLVNEFRFGINVISDKLHNVPPVTNTQVGINLPTANGDPNIYRFTFGAFAFGPFPQEPQTAVSDSFVWLDTVSWTRGAHTLRWGGEIDRTAIRRNLPVADNGLLFFASGVTAFGSDFQSFLAGAPFFGEAGGGVGNHDYRIPARAWFVQDDYRMRKDLTLNLGFRNEFLGAPFDELCHLGNTDAALGLKTGQPFVYPRCATKFNLGLTTATKERGALNNNYATVWEPRIGFAYDVFGRHTTSLRGGYAIYSVREDLGAVDNLSFSAPFFPIAVNFLPGAGSLPNLFQPNAATGFAGIPPYGVLSANFVPQPTFLQSMTTSGCSFPLQSQCSPVFTGNGNSLIGLNVPLHWIAATTQQWNLTIQQQLWKNWVLEAGYVGSKGTRLRSTYDPDQATLATPQHPVVLPGVTCNGATPCKIVDSTVENAGARAPFLPLSPAAYESFAPNSDSHYNSLQLSLAHHYSKGLYWQTGYTYSKSIDDVSTASVAFDTRFNDQNNPRDSRGLSDFDRRHRFVSSWVYELPFFSHAGGATQKALGGWEASGVITLQSGSPFTPIDSGGGSAYALSSPNLATPNFAPGFNCANALTHGSMSARLTNWANPNAYTPDPKLPLSTGGLSDATGYGAAPRNCIIGPPQKNVDFTLGKTFRVSENQTLRFRADFFNLFNHPSFANPSATDVESPSSFTQITSVVGTPRLIQFSLKYSF